MERCSWCGKDPLMIKYHDEEWGNPLHDEQRHFEFLLLECMQAGLSWSTILNKRENFREAFDGFDYRKVAVYNEEKILTLLNNPGIIRYRLKIESAINNANRFMEIQEEFGSFDKYIWGFTGGKPVDNGLRTTENMPVTSDLSDEVSKDLKKRGFKFVGSTTIYAHLQAIGVINDHLVNCFRYKEVKNG